MPGLRGRRGPRRAKRLAHRVRAWARQARAERVVHTSPLQRGVAVGRWLRRWGWRHCIDARLLELDFGDWTGRPWSEIGAAPVDAWCAAFVDHAPGGGETVGALLARCAAFAAEHASGTAPCIVIGHAGWISAAQWLATHRDSPNSAAWPTAVAYGTRVELGILPA
jgi:alpha-ribazole phosphatase